VRGRNRKFEKHWLLVLECCCRGRWVGEGAPETCEMQRNCSGQTLRKKID